ncbi:MAG TPA: GspH/FimT family pseudopilin [Gammaproteobacteria bacterium]|nr:GspH/FimT family pseudopilin [Gammaproteobacteria bacterium]
MRTRGFTLWELVCTLSIAAICTTIGVPALRNLALDSRRTANINAFVLAVQLARSESFKRGRPVVVCKTADTLACAGDDLRYDAGWMVFVNEDDMRPPSRRPEEPLLFVHRPSAGAHITSNRAFFEFRPYPRRSTNGTITFCDARGSAAARAVVVSYTGRPRASGRDAGGRPLVCAE